MQLSDEELDFGRYLELRRRADRAGRYAYGPDQSSLAALSKLRPLELAVAAAVRVYKDSLKGELLGTTVRVGPDQLPRIHGLARRCAESLGVELPALYVRNQPFANASTFGTRDDAYIVLHSSLIDQLDERELSFVIGHELGHVQNGHVVYSTVLRLLQRAVGVFLGWTVRPASLALSAWSRNAEITCDRAGLLCCGDLAVASRALMKIACGSQTLYRELDLDSYLRQVEEGRGGIGRFREWFRSHPYLPKRVQALRVFADSRLYRRHVGLGDDGLELEEVDRRVAAIVGVARAPVEG